MMTASPENSDINGAFMKTEQKEKIIFENAQEDNIHCVLFVCTGNTCRSPMAEAVYNYYAKKYGIATKAVSAGVAASGAKMSSHARTALIEAGYIDENYEHISRQIDEGMCMSADSIVGMTEAHAMRLLMHFPVCATKIRALEKDIVDPFGGYIDTYRESLSEIAEAIKTEFFKAFGEK